MRKKTIFYIIMSILLSSVFTLLWHWKEQNKFLVEGKTIIPQFDTKKAHSPDFRYDSSYPQLRDWKIWGDYYDTYTYGMIDTERGKAFFVKPLPLDEDAKFYSKYIGLGQAIKADSFINQRIRFSADVNFNGHIAFLYLRFDQNEGNCISRKENMYKADEVHDANWHTQEIVVDVPSNIKIIKFGVQAWAKTEMLVNNFKLQIVDKNTPLVNDRLPEHKDFEVLDKPKNMNLDSTYIY